MTDLIQGPIADRTEQVGAERCIEDEILPPPPQFQQDVLCGVLRRGAGPENDFGHHDHLGIMGMEDGLERLLVACTKALEKVALVGERVGQFLSAACGGTP